MESRMTMHMNGHSDTERRMFEKELVSHLSSLRGFAVSISGRHDRADDLVQTTCMKALKQWRGYEFGTNMKAWLFTILRNEFYSYMRKASVKNELGWIDELEDSMLYSTHLSDGGQRYDFKRHLLYIACLPRDQCDAFIAVCYLGLDYIDAASRFGCAVGTIKSRVSRARARLVEMIESNTSILEAKLDSFKTAAKGVPESHPLYPLAKAYEELYADSEDVEEKNQVEKPPHPVDPRPPSKSDALWDALVASGALDDSEENLAELMQFDPEDV